MPPILPIGDLQITPPRRSTLPNGIALNVIHAGEADVVRIDFVFRSGVMHQDMLTQCNFVSSMLRNSTKDYTQQTINERLDYYGAWMKTGSRVESTSVTLFSLNKYFAETLSLVASMLFRPLFLQSEIDLLIADRTQQYWVNSRKVNMLGYRALNKSLYGEGHLLGTTATPDDFARITSADLHRFHRQHFFADNCTIYLSGKVTEEILRTVEQMFGTAVWGEVSERPDVTLSPPNSTVQRRISVHQEGTVQSAVNIGHITINDQHPDYIPLTVATTLLGGYFGSRLMSNIREEKGYTYGINSWMLQNPNESILLVGTETENKYVEPLIDEVYKEMRTLHTEKVAEEELNMVKNYMLGNICRSYEGAFSLAEAWIANDLSALGDEYFQYQVDSISRTTAEDICRLAQTYFQPERFVEVVAGDIPSTSV